MNINQVAKILKEHIDISGMAKDIAASVSTQEVKIIKVKEFPKERFIDNNDGTITDTHFGLAWVKNPQTDLPKKFRCPMIWKNAIRVCKKLNFAGHKDWRLPTVEELRSIIDYTCGGKTNEPAINNKFFPDTECFGYWTSTICVWGSGLPWHIDFAYGGCVSYSYDSVVGYYVRPVRSSR